MREKTYYPILALIQVASTEMCVVIDPIAVSSLAPLFEILHNPEIQKVFHAGKQDLEIFFQESQKPVRNIFDTQIAASLIGLGAQVSLLKLVEIVSGVSLDKSETYTDWMRRPLSDSQIEYALNDVRYLLAAKDYLTEKLRESGREGWIGEEFVKHENPELYATPQPEAQYQRIKGFRTLKSRNLAVLRELAGWRELEARKRNRFLNAIIREEALLGIARRIPKTIKELQLIRGIKPKEVQLDGKIILKLIEKGLETPDSELPVLPPQEKNGLTRGIVDFLWTYAQHKAGKQKISASFLASRNEIRELVQLRKNGSAAQHPLLNGWKKELIGNDLMEIISGEATIGFDPVERTIKLYRKI